MKTLILLLIACNMYGQTQQGNNLTLEYGIGNIMYSGTRTIEPVKYPTFDTIQVRLLISNEGMLYTATGYQVRKYCRDPGTYCVNCSYDSYYCHYKYLTLHKKEYPELYEIWFSKKM